MSDAVLVAMIMSIPGTIAAIASLYNFHNLRRLERNTNSISERNEAIAKKLGIQEGRASEKSDQAVRDSK
jgi:hypothetical protein